MDTIRGGGGSVKIITEKMTGGGGGGLECLLCLWCLMCLMFAYLYCVFKVPEWSGGRGGLQRRGGGKYSVLCLSVFTMCFVSLSLLCPFSFLLKNT